jgi:tryptophan synthase alpha chain
VTGAANLDIDDIARKLPAIRAHIKLPIGVGFGIRDAHTARLVAKVADAVVIGTRIVQEMEASPRAQVLDNIRFLVKDIRTALDQ